VVEFRGQAACKMIDDDKLLAVDRRVLAQPTADVLRKAAGALAKSRGTDAASLLADALAASFQPSARSRYALEASIARGIEAANEVEPVRKMERSLLVSYIADFVEQAYPHADAPKAEDEPGA
jgi:hypothetical protein